MKSSPVAIFIAATAIVAASSLQTNNLANSEELGGLKEWTTDESIDAEGTLDKAAKAAKKKAKEEDVCIPIGEGENCW
ncbi:hypothetical protein [Prochlorococcus marinus]|uniref:Peptidase family M20/M25/M40 n=1 Tax=Prochlorococcus marinus (strain MIT 9211) TaxID=93059 RepID=A9BBH6_PROM4|nr:hypothetical protein [Prochlorococcus marinus]ABX09188.1 Hypothetical protein P9211_12571 [Prochlorococcus marinus str. MIT 9211]